MVGREKKMSQYFKLIHASKNYSFLHEARTINLGSEDRRTNRESCHYTSILSF